MSKQCALEASITCSRNAHNGKAAADITGLEPDLSMSPGVNQLTHLAMHWTHGNRPRVHHVQGQAGPSLSSNLLYNQLEQKRMSNLLSLS